MVGKLPFVALAVPAGRALMIPLNMALCHEPPTVGNKKNGPVHEALLDWFKLVEDLGKRPTSVHDIVTGKIDFYGYCNACNTGAGEVWFPLDSSMDPIVWRVQWPEDVYTNLTTWDGISISDGECTGVLLQQMVLEVEVTCLKHKKAILAL